MKIFRVRRPMKCEQCGGPLWFLGAGEYECHDCKARALDDYGKVRHYIEENGMATQYELETALDIPGEIIESFLDNGTLYDPGSPTNICKGCGCVVTYGRYCKDCIRDMGSKLKAEFYVEPELHKEIEEEEFAKPEMRFLKRGI